VAAQHSATVAMEIRVVFNKNHARRGLSFEFKAHS
jgi:hypothetical protein